MITSKGIINMLTGQQIIDQLNRPISQEEFQKFLASEPFPHFHPHKDKDKLIKEEADGTKSVGLFRDGKWINLDHEED